METERAVLRIFWCVFCLENHIVCFLNDVLLVRTCPPIVRCWFGLLLSKSSSSMSGRTIQGHAMKF